MPLYAEAVSVVGTPSESNAQPAGISGWWFRKALKTLPAATVVVAMSSSQGPGTDMQMGLVPRRPSRPCQGGTIGDALHITIPICPAALHLLGPPGGSAEMVRFTGGDHRQAMLAGHADRVAAAGLGDPLADAILPIEKEAGSGFGNDRAVGERVHLSRQELVDIERE